MPNNLPPNYQQIIFNQNLFSCRLASTTNLTGTLNPANNLNGLGTTLFNTGVLAVLSIDATLPLVGDRVLLAGQTNKAQNGLYVVFDAGSTLTPWILTRAPDWCSNNEMVPGQYCPIEDGATLKGKMFVFVRPAPLQINVNDINFVQLL